MTLHRTQSRRTATQTEFTHLPSIGRRSFCIVYGLGDQDWGWNASEVDMSVSEEDEGTTQNRLVEEEKLHASEQILTVWHKYSRLIT